MAEMRGSPRGHGVAVYQAAHRASLRSPAAILLALHEEVLREILAAKTAYEKKMLDRMCGHTARSIRILTSLRASLNFEAAGPQGRMLERYYAATISEISGVLRFADPLAAFENLASHSRAICREMEKRTKSV